MGPGKGRCPWAVISRLSADACCSEMTHEVPGRVWPPCRKETAPKVLHGWFLSIQKLDMVEPQEGFVWVWLPREGRGPGE